MFIFKNILENSTNMEEINIRKIFGGNVKKYRKKLGLSQEQLSERLGITPNHLSVIETGAKFVTYKLLEKIVAELQVMPMSLFFTEGSAPLDESKINKINAIIQRELSLCATKIQDKIQEEMY